MKTLPVLIASSWLALCSPAFGQAVMTDFSWPEMRTALEGVKATVTSESDDTEGVHFLAAKDDKGLNFSIFGQACDAKGPAQRCRGAEIVATFEFDEEEDIPDALAGIDYAAVFAGDDEGNGVKLLRYVIFDEGITAGNLRVNLNVFLNIANKVWEYLEDEGYLG